VSTEINIYCMLVKLTTLKGWWKLCTVAYFPKI